jgi:hypothetical protein
LAASENVSRHRPSGQRIVSGGHAGRAQLPPVQPSPAGHGRRQPPQCAALVCVSTQTPSQHAPDAHGRPQAPQFCGSPCTLRQAPLQQAVPAGQGAPHAPQFAGSDRIATHTSLQHRVRPPAPHAGVHG